MPRVIKDTVEVALWWAVAVEAVIFSSLAILYLWPHIAVQH